VRVQNAVDEAVEVNVAGQVATLEPQDTHSFLVLVGDKRTTVELTASLVSNPSVSATASVTVQKNKTTDVRVTSNTSGTALSITVVKK
jgi:hypothetical protein